MYFSEKGSTVKGLNPNKPYVILNLKTYAESSGENAVMLAKIAQKVQKKTGVNFIICPQTLDLKEVVNSVSIPVYAQHTDYFKPGKSTGDTTPESLLAIHVHGSILNHSEHRLDAKVLQETILRLKELNIKTVVCAKDEKEAKKLAAMKPVKPDYISVEPPLLIGGEISVSTAKPDIIKKTVDACAGIPVIVGAGIKDNADMKVALSLGAKGVLLASHFVLSKNPEEFLMKLLEGTY